MHFCRHFTEDEIAQLKNTKIKDVILAVTNIDEDDMQTNPFFLDGWYIVLIPSFIANLLNM